MKELLIQLLEGQKNLQKSMNRVEGKIDNHAHEFRSHFKQLDRSLKEHRYVIDHISSKVESEARKLKARVQVIEEKVFGDEH